MNVEQSFHRCKQVLPFGILLLCSAQKITKPNLKLFSILTLLHLAFCKHQKKSLLLSFLFFLNNLGIKFNQKVFLLLTNVYFFIWLVLSDVVSQLMKKNLFVLDHSLLIFIQKKIILQLVHFATSGLKYCNLVKNTDTLFNLCNNCSKPSFIKNLI